jgi:hypothetical protein
VAKTLSEAGEELHKVKSNLFQIIVKELRLVVLMNWLTDKLNRRTK